MFTPFLHRPLPPRWASPHAARLGYVPGLDGMRALAVLAVLVYHADVAWLPGGFLGVEIFFVVSGYLITALLLAEYHTAQTVDLKQFWQRRARRLLPALVVVILVVLLYAVTFLPEEVAGLRADAVSALTYSTNWYLILTQKSYFETVGRPSLLRHLWSLAVEEQFYLLWPLFFASVLGRLKAPCALLVVLAGAVTSALWMGLLYQPDTDPSRVYYGTDTRAAGILLGAALAFGWTPWESRASRTRVAGWLLETAAWIALGLLVVMCVQVNEFTPGLYSGGMWLVAVATIVMIAAVVHPQSRLFGPLLGTRVLRWIGVRSYSLYLWHWPVFMVTRPQLDVTVDGAALFALRIGVTFVLAELSYRLVETPIRHGALGKAWTAWHQARGVQRWGWGLAGMGLIAPAVVAILLLGSAVMNAQPPRPPVDGVLTAADPAMPFEMHAQTPEASETPRAATSAWVVGAERDGQRHHSDAATQAGVAHGWPCAAACQTQPDMRPMQEGRRPAAVPATTSVAVPQRTTPAQVLAIGDSVMLGAAQALRQAVPDVDLDAHVGRQVSAALQIVRMRKEARLLAPAVIIHLGNNGVFSGKQFDEMMTLLQEVPRVVFLTTKVPRPWQEPNNSALAAGVRRYPNARLADWYTQGAAHPEWFWKDGLHLRPEGAKMYANLIAATMR